MSFPLCVLLHPVNVSATKECIIILISSTNSHMKYVYSESEMLTETSLYQVVSGITSIEIEFLRNFYAQRNIFGRYGNIKETIRIEKF